MRREDVPWDRIVHFYGRATDVPGWIEDLVNLSTRERRICEELIAKEGIEPVIDAGADESEQTRKKPWWRFW